MEIYIPVWVIWIFAGLIGLGIGILALFGFFFLYYFVWKDKNGGRWYRW